MLRNFCFLLLFLVIFINITMLPNYTLKPDSRLSIYSTDTIAYAQQHQPQQAAVIPAINNSQEWIDNQSNTKIQFTYINYTKAVGSTIKTMLSKESVKRQEEVWNIVTEQVKNNYANVQMLIMVLLWE